MNNILSESMNKGVEIINSMKVDEKITGYFTFSKITKEVRDEIKPMITQDQYDSIESLLYYTQDDETLMTLEKIDENTNVTMVRFFKGDVEIGVSFRLERNSIFRSIILGLIGLFIEAHTEKDSQANIGENELIYKSLESIQKYCDSTYCSECILSIERLYGKAKTTVCALRNNNLKPKEWNLKKPDVYRAFIN